MAKHDSGLDLRDEFAIAALQGLIASNYSKGTTDSGRARLTERAYEIANAMLVSRANVPYA